jgi:phage shock protein C
MSDVGKEGKNMKRLHVSSTNKKILGVCGGVAETFDLDPTLVRLAVVLLALLTAVLPVTLMYVVAGLIMPKEA